MLRTYRPDDDSEPLPTWFNQPGELEQIGSQTALFEESRGFFAAVANRQPLLMV